MLDLAKYYSSEKTLKHVNRVYALCNEFIDFGVCVEKNLLLDAVVLHDVAKDTDNDTHHTRRTIERALWNMGISPSSVVRFDDLCIIIENHKECFSPSKFEMESATLRICDKLDKFEKAKEAAEKAYYKKISKANANGWSEEKGIRKAQKKYHDVYEEGKICTASRKQERVCGII